MILACLGMFLRSLGIKRKSVWTYEMFLPSYNSIFQRKMFLMGQFHSPPWSSAQREGCIQSGKVRKAQRTQDCPRPMLTLHPFTCKTISWLNGSEWSLTSPEWIEDYWPPCFSLWTDLIMIARSGKYKSLIWSQEEREKILFYYKVQY